MTISIEYQCRERHKDPEQNICQILDKVAAAAPSHIALWTNAGVKRKGISFRELQSRVTRRSEQLLQAGVVHGNRVLVLQNMSPELYITLLALFRIGAAAIFVDNPSSRRSLECAFSELQPDAVIASGLGIALALYSKSVRRTPLKLACGINLPGWQKLDSNNKFRERPGNLSAFPVDGDTPALITLTSGTSGQPKIISRSHSFLLEQLAAIEKATSMGEGAVELTTLPVFVLANIAKGATTILPRSSGATSNVASELVKQLNDYQADRLLTSPAVVSSIADYCIAQQIKIPSVARLYTGGGPVFPEMLSRAQNAFPNASIEVVYGSSEAEPISHYAWSEADKRTLDLIEKGAGLPVGKPVASTMVRTLPLKQPIDDASRNRRFAAMQHICEIAGVSLSDIGEVVVSGPQVVKGYFNGRGDADKKFQEAGLVWHRTGDVGYFDKNGNLWLVGNVSEPGIGEATQVHMDTTFSRAVEASALSSGKCKRAAFFCGDAGAKLFLEANREASGHCSMLEDSSLSLIRERTSWAEPNEVRILKTIPMDARHKTKVVYKQLQ